MIKTIGLLLTTAVLHAQTIVYYASRKTIEAKTADTENKFTCNIVRRPTDIWIYCFVDGNKLHVNMLLSRPDSVAIPCDDKRPISCIMVSWKSNETWQVGVGALTREGKF